MGHEMEAGLIQGFFLWGHPHSDNTTYDFGVKGRYSKHLNPRP